VPLFATVLETGTTADRQGAFAAIGGLTGDAPEADAILSAWLDRLAEGKLDPEIELDLLDAAARRSAPALAAKAKAIEDARPKSDPLAAYLPTLLGGNPRRGQEIVRNKAEVQCIRCHKVNGRGGEVGPELAGVAARGDRRYLLESIVQPDKQIAKGFESVVVATADGQLRTGVLREETDAELRLITAEGKTLAIPKSEIEERKRGSSAMPIDLLKFLSRSELRDVVAYLATLKTPWTGRPAE
jgi:quinoprotein glucose dehydrogenase